MATSADAELRALRERVAKLELDEALLRQEVSAMKKTIETYNTGMGRLLWLIGGGFIAAIVSWIAQGGLNGKV